MPGYGDRREVLGAALDPAERAQVLDRIAHRGVDFVAKEAVTLSTTPVWRDGRLEPRRSRCACSWRASMAGGSCPAASCRVADDVDARAVSLQRGGRTGDAWVLSDKPVAETTLLPAPTASHLARDGGAAEPGRRQPVLGGSLRGARRGDASAGPGARQPRRR